MTLSPDSVAARAATLFVILSLDDPTALRVSAALYLAERTHLERHGSLMFGAAYTATSEGPLCDGVEETLSSYWLPSEPDLDELSVGAVQALSASLRTCAELTPAALAGRVRDVAWAEAACSGGIITAEMIARALPNALELLAYLADPYPGEATLRR